MRFSIIVSTFVLAFASTVAGAETPPVKPIGQSIALPAEPDYEEEKVRFQRGTEPYYGLQAVAVPSDARARERVAKAARDGSAKAMVQMGLASEQGRGAPQDFADAMRWYERAAQRGSADARFLLGLMHMQGKGVPAIDYAKAREWLAQAAAKNSVPAWVNLGWLDEFGRGIDQPDPASAMRWYRRAADRGDTLAQYDVGTLHGHGKGVPLDAAQARIWLRKAADKNYAPAFYSLAVLDNTPGSERNAVAAYQWFTLALAARYPGVKYDVEQLRAELSAEQIQQADAWVETWTKRHSK